VVAATRVYQLAKELGWESRAVMAKLAEIGRPVPSVAWTLSPDVVERLRLVAAADGPPALPPRPPVDPFEDDYREDGPEALYYAHPDQKVTTAVAARMCEVRPSTIRKWASRGYLTAVGREGRRVRDVLSAARRNRSPRRGRRTPPTADSSNFPFVAWTR
jgi:hypothetical protein